MRLITPLSPLAEFTPLSSDRYCELLPGTTNEDLTIAITTGDVFEKLFAPNPKKAHGPDGILV